MDPSIEPGWRPDGESATQSLSWANARRRGPLIDLPRPVEAREYAVERSADVAVLVSSCEDSCGRAVSNVTVTFLTKPNSVLSDAPGRGPESTRGSEA